MKEKLIITTICIGVVFSTMVWGQGIPANCQRFFSQFPGNSSNIPPLTNGTCGCFTSNSIGGELCACDTNGVRQTWQVDTNAAEAEYSQDTTIMLGVNGTIGNAQQGSVENPIVTP